MRPILFLSFNGGPDGHYALQMTAEGTLGFADLTPYNKSGKRSMFLNPLTLALRLPPAKHTHAAFRPEQPSPSPPTPTQVDYIGQAVHTTLAPNY